MVYLVQVQTTNQFANELVLTLAQNGCRVREVEMTKAGDGLVDLRVVYALGIGFTSHSIDVRDSIPSQPMFTV
jgi:hypothetical protein